MSCGTTSSSLICMQIEFPKKGQKIFEKIMVKHFQPKFQMWWKVEIHKFKFNELLSTRKLHQDMLWPNCSTLVINRNYYKQLGLMGWGRGRDTLCIILRQNKNDGKFLVWKNYNETFRKLKNREHVPIYSVRLVSSSIQNWTKTLQEKKITD